MVTVEAAIPSAPTGPVPVIVEFAATGVPAKKLTVPSTLFTGAVILRVLISAFVEVSEQVLEPVAFVVEQAPYELELPVSVALKDGMLPATGLLLAS